MEKGLVLSIVLISVGVLLSPFMSNTFNVPVAVVEVMYGIILGRSFFNLIQPSRWLAFLSYFGFLMLMFLAGLEVNFSEIKKLATFEKVIVSLIPIVIFALSFILGGAVGFSPIVDAAVGAVSVGVVVSVLREKGLLESRFGKFLFLTGTVGEFLSIFILTLLSIYYKFSLSGEFFIKIFELLIFFLVARLFLRFMKALMWWYPKKLRMFFEKSPTEIGVRISIVVMFALSALASLIDVEPILGAFIAGMIFSSVFGETEKIEEKLSGISFGFLIPVFFIYVGIKFKMPHFDVATLELLGLLVIFSYVSKILPSFLFYTLGFNIKESLSAGFLLSAPLTLVIVAAEVGKSLSVIKPEIESALILLAIATAVISPVIFNVLSGGKGAAASTGRG